MDLTELGHPNTQSLATLEMAVWTEGVGGKQVLECPALWLLLFLLRELTSVLPLGRSMGGRRP